MRNLLNTICIYLFKCSLTHALNIRYRIFWVKKYKGTADYKGGWHISFKGTTVSGDEGLINAIKWAVKVHNMNTVCETIQPKLPIDKTKINV